MHSITSINLDTANNTIAILEGSVNLNSETISIILSALAGYHNLDSVIASLTAVLLLAPDLASHIPASILDHWRIQQSPVIWESLAILLLHSELRPSIVKHLQAKILHSKNWTFSINFLRHIFDWFPEELSLDLLRSLSKEICYSEIGAELLERQMLRKGIINQTAGDRNNPLFHMQYNYSRLLVIHNIVDGQGDEIVRLHALLQALLDGFPNLEVMLFTDRCYLYDHPRVQTTSISDNESFARALNQKWDGILNFFEPYLPSNSYNTVIESALAHYLHKNFPPFYLWARKDINHFTFETVIIESCDFTQEWQVNRRRLKLNYETTMRLIAKLGLPIRIGEDKPVSPLATANSQPNIETLWQKLNEDFRTKCDGKERSIAIVNVFGGYQPMKGFESANFGQVAQILMHLSSEGYNTVLVPNGESWGGLEQIEAIRACLPERLRKHVSAAPLPAGHTAQEAMRIIKYFVAWADLVVTVEGWMAHLAYTLGQPYLLLMAPYSYTSEWQPHGCSSNQKRWIPKRDKVRRLELTFPVEKSLKPPILHYPEKALLQASLEIWALTGTRQLGERLQYWLGSPDKDIRRMAINTIAQIDTLYFRKDLIGTLDDSNREVRAAAASALIRSGQDLALHFGPNWRKILLAYQLIGDFRFQDLRPLGEAAYPALRACVRGDDAHVSRDAKIIAEAIQLPGLESVDVMC